MKVFIKDAGHIVEISQWLNTEKRLIDIKTYSAKQQVVHANPCIILTLYLSTMGNLTGPSLDLLKFGKLSRCEMNGNPLQLQQMES